MGLQRPLGVQGIDQVALMQQMAQDAPKESAPLSYRSAMKWTPEMDKRLLDAFERLGTKFTSIAKEVRVSRDQARARLRLLGKVNDNKRDKGRDKDKDKDKEKATGEDRKRARGDQDGEEKDAGSEEKRPKGAEQATEGATGTAAKEDGGFTPPWAAKGAPPIGETGVPGAADGASEPSGSRSSLGGVLALPSDPSDSLLLGGAVTNDVDGAGVLAEAMI